MLTQIFLALAIGITAGTVTGLIPGIHINLIAAILISLSIFFLQFTTPTILLIFIVAMSITHTFIDFIPSIFLGAPDEDTILSILPGHELLKQGKGYQAIVLTTYGSISAILIILLLSPIFIYSLPRFEKTLTFLIPFILILSTIFIISKEKNKLPALIVFILSGFLGIGVLSSNVQQPFLPMLGGLFGASSLLISLKAKTKIPKQKVGEITLPKKYLLKPLLAAAFAAPLCTLLPGIGSGQAALIGASLIKTTKQNFLILLGATNTIVIGLSFIVFFSIAKTRTGVASLTGELINSLTPRHILIIIATIALTGIICFYWTIFLAKFFSSIVHKTDYSRISIATLIIITILVFAFSGPFGIFIFLISTATGIFGIMSNVKRINLMGCLVIPVILIYL